MKKTFVVFAALALVAGFALTAAAAEYDFYGNARMATFWTSQDAPEVGGAPVLDLANQDSEDNIGWALQGNSRVGANIQSGDIKAQFEFSFTSVGGGGNVGARRLYGIWDFGAGGLKVGKDYTPITYFLSGQVFGGDAGLLNVGNAYGARRGQIELRFGGFKVAFIDQTTPVGLVNQATGLAPAGGIAETTLPKIEASFDMKMDTFSWHVFGGYQTYDINFANTPTTSASIGVDSYVFGGGATVDVGPVFIKGQASIYQNGQAAGWLFNLPNAYDGAVDPTPLGALGPGLAVSQLPTLDANNDVVDVDSLMACLVVGFKVNENNTIEGGFGYLDSDQDLITGGSAEIQYQEYYVQWVAQIAPGVFIIPEAGIRDFGDFEAQGNPTIDLGETSYFGAKWQINF